jgi:ABC-type molybdate transport system permease subunit
MEASGLAQSVWNSLRVGLYTTVISVSLAFLYAYGIHRTQMFGKAFFRIVAMIPLFAPTMLYGLSLVYMFGNKGVITTGFFDRFPWLAWDIQLYGLTGIVIAEVVFTFPPAFMILLVALSNTDARLYEASESLGAGKVRTFFTVTIPSIKFGLLSAIFVAFTLSFTDFGAPESSRRPVQYPCGRHLQTGHRSAEFRYGRHGKYHFADTDGFGLYRRSHRSTSRHGHCHCPQCTLHAQSQQDYVTQPMAAYVADCHLYSADGLHGGRGIAGENLALCLHQPRKIPSNLDPKVTICSMTSAAAAMGPSGTASEWRADGRFRCYCHLYQRLSHR